MMLNVLCLIFSLSAVVNSVQLESYNVDGDAISVSGLSAGGFMAVQMHVSFSKTFMGVGVLAAGPYWCAQANVITATGACMTSPGLINVKYLQQITRNTALTGYADGVYYMEDDKVFLFSGYLDTTVVPGVVETTEEYYSEFVDANNVKKVYTVPSEHGFPTMNNGGSCGEQSDTYINKCGYDGAYELLEHIYGDLQRPSYDNSAMPGGSVLEFDQSEFFGGILSGNIGLVDIGYVFIPDSCKDGIESCRLHVALHGCLQGSEFIQDTFVKETGYNEVAALNNIIVLYPQVEKNALTNPKGCFDWWGYTGTSYGSNKGDQMVAIHKMIERLANM